MQDAVPEGALVQRGWRGLQVVGPLDFALTGGAAALTAPLAEAEVSVLPIATYDTDYLFVREETLAPRGRDPRSRGPQSRHRLVTVTR